MFPIIYLSYITTYKHEKSVGIMSLLILQLVSPNTLPEMSITITYAVYARATRRRCRMQR